MSKEQKLISFAKTRGVKLNPKQLPNVDKTLEAIKCLLASNPRVLTKEEVDFLNERPCLTIELFPLERMKYKEVYDFKAISHLYKYISNVPSSLEKMFFIRTERDSPIENLIEAEKALRIKRDQLAQPKKTEKKRVVKPHQIENGVYGIYVNDSLVYIGMTTRDFKERWDEHKRCAFNPTENDNKLAQQNYLYKAMREAETWEFKILYLNTDKLNKREIQCVEMGMITLNKPKYNYEGVKVPYRFS